MIIEQIDEYLNEKKAPPKNEVINTYIGTLRNFIEKGNIIIIEHQGGSSTLINISDFDEEVYIEEMPNGYTLNLNVGFKCFRDIDNIPVKKLKSDIKNMMKFYTKTNILK